MVRERVYTHMKTAREVIKNRRDAIGRSKTPGIFLDVKNDAAAGVCICARARIVLNRLSGGRENVDDVRERERTAATSFPPLLLMVPEAAFLLNE